MAKVARIQTLTLTSGMKVQVRRPSVLSLITSEGFPQDLTIAVWKLIKKDQLDPDMIGHDAEAIRTWARLITAYVPEVLVNPRVTDVTELVPVEGDPGRVSGTIEMRDISDMDKQFLFLYGNGVVPSNEEMEAGVSSGKVLEALRTFRDRAARGDAGPGGEAVRAEAVEPAGVESAGSV